MTSPKTTTGDKSTASNTSSYSSGTSSSNIILGMNTQLIHLAMEIIIFAGVFYYFHTKTKTLTKTIEELSAKIEERDIIIQKHDHAINQLIEMANSSMKNRSVKDGPSNNGRPNIRPAVRQNVIKQPGNKSKSKFKSKSRPSKKPPLATIIELQEETPSVVEEYESDSENDSDLDAEIEDELRELKEEEASLKKK